MGAHTTGSDAPWAGVPFVSTPGATFASRVGASLLAAAELGDLVAADRVAYEDLAVHLGCDADARARLRERLAAARTRCALFDTARSVRSLERTYLAMWARSRAGLAPATFATPDDPGETARAAAASGDTTSVALPRRDDACVAAARAPVNPCARGAAGASDSPGA
jgi:hypothetical protein